MGNLTFLVFFNLHKGQNTFVPCFTTVYDQQPIAPKTKNQVHPAIALLLPYWGVDSGANRTFICFTLSIFIFFCMGLPQTRLTDPVILTNNQYQPQHQFQLFFKGNQRNYITMSPNGDITSSKSVVVSPAATISQHKEETMTKAERQTVTFSQYSQLALIPKDKNASEKWYSSKESRRFRKTFFEDARRVSSEIEQGKIPEAYETVGIEPFTTPGLLKWIQDAKCTHVNTVLLEQEFQRQSGFHDPERLANASSQSSWTKDRAQVLATGYWLQYIFEQD